MKIAFSILVLLSSILVHAGPKNKIRWPAQSSPQVARNIIQCDFPKNSLEIAAVEIFASTTSKGSAVILSNISTVVSITANGGFRALSFGGELAIPESSEIAGNITLAGNSATFNFAKGIGKMSLGGVEMIASSCTSFIK